MRTPGRHQRLPAAPGRDPGFVANLAARQPDGGSSSTHRRGRARPSTTRRSRTPSCGTRLVHAARRRTSCGGPRRRAGRGLRPRVVRRGRPAGPAGQAAPAGAGGRQHARPRGRLGAAARCPPGAAPHRPRRRRGDATSASTPGSASPRPCAGPGSSACRAASTRRSSGRARTARTCARRTGWSTGRSSSASRGSSRARARTCWCARCPRCAAGYRTPPCCSSAAAPTRRGCSGWPPRPASPSTSC